jgi:dTDP-4-amino-4,6-dideoxygalactose transaminase
MNESKPIRLSKSCVGKEEKIALIQVLDDGYLGMGKEVQLFESELQEFLGTNADVICVNTGTSGLHLALSCLDIGPGDEVLVPTITYVASFQAITATGAKPVACDVTLNRVFIDLEDAKKRLTPNTKAIMPVHYASDSQGMLEVFEFAGKHNLRVIEDAAHSFGGSRHGNMVGYAGDVICFSFDGIKNITAGEGGAVVTADKRLSQRIKDARLLGVEKDTDKRYSGDRSWRFNVQYQGYRYHMSNLMAAIGRTQLKKIRKFVEHRKKCVNHYRQSLKGLVQINFLDLDYENNAPHIFVIRVRNNFRDSLMNFLIKENIECGLHYMPNHLLEYFSSSYILPISMQLSNELLSLPLHSELTEDEQDRVISKILEFFSVN